MFHHQDTLQRLNENIPLGEKLSSVHEAIKAQFPFIDRIAVAIYDAKTDTLKTYVHSSGGDSPLQHYQAAMADAPSLQEIVKLRKPRVVNDLNIFANGSQKHSQSIQKQGYASSYTLPMFLNDEFFGFVFFNSMQKEVFDGSTLHYFDIIGHLISLLIINEQSSVRTLLATVKTAHDMTHHRDSETGAHIDRMSRYSRLIALHIADRHNLDDEYIENVFLFSPLHDIGKIAIGDNILQKKGKLTEEEIEIMRTHANKGGEIIDSMLKDHGLDTFENINILRNIAEYHHEAVNGTGYPRGLQGEEIPLEARIVAVADVFDALTSKRPYKEAWSNHDAYAMLQRLAGGQLDKECVDALIANKEEVEKIQREFAEDPLG
ncbi:MAG TPA: HD domain-containing protein [Gammaproteobacteria bacterium]|nr:HD domain-containing protein [Gammaproteobacteria bacterium]